MSVYLHVGQCGNQLGAAFWRLAAASSENNDKQNPQQTDVHISQPICSGPSRVAVHDTSDTKLASLSPHLFHPSTHAARCILVDTEPKVIQSICKAGGKRPISFQPAHTHVEQAGRGNNWAMGYFGPRQSQAPAATFGQETPKELVELVLESVRREIETIDCYQGSMVMHSLGGGTGSGLSCQILERWRDLYPKAYLLTASVAPSWTRGDSPLQHYNAVLTLQCLQQVADAVIYKDNDELLRTATYWKTIEHKKKSTGTDATSERVSFAEINSLAAAELAGLLFPMATHATSLPRSFDYGKFVHDLCPLPAAKILDIRSGVWKTPHVRSKGRSNASTTLFHAFKVAPNESQSTSSSMLEKLVQQTIASFPRSLHASIASSTILRGVSCDLNDTTGFSHRMHTLVETKFPFVPWVLPMVQPTLTWSKHKPFPSLQAPLSATICVNNGHFLTSTSHFLERAQRQFHARAYVHWYKQHGMEDDDFYTASQQCHTLVRNYETLLR